MPLGAARAVLTSRMVAPGGGGAITEDVRTFHSLSTAAETHTFSRTIGTLTNGYLLVKLAWEAAGVSISAVKIGTTNGTGGTSLTAAGSAADGGGDTWAQIWYLANPPDDAAYDFWIDPSAAAAIGAEVVTLSNVLQAAPNDYDVGTAISTNPVSTPALTITGSGNWLETIAARTSTGGNFVASSDQGTPTEHTDTAVGDGQVATSSQSGLTGSSVTPTWSSTTSGGKALAAVILRPAA